MTEPVTTRPVPSEAPPRLTLLRALSFSYDVFVVAVLWTFAGVAGVAANRGEAIPAGTVWFGGVLAGVTFAYFVYSWYRGGQTLGMRAWRLEVSSIQGNRPSPSQASLRFLVGLLLGVDLLWTYLDREGRSLADRASGTRVRRLPRRPGGHRRQAPS